ncbi:hypothetical protein [Phenylobacterium sp. 58.2.17]|uniref:hypothetical protein n=1 Tax=Phenylobacterium sp. 58.2.17 TaxID=2969306 RepID=UPI002263D000|nr:hypothetical protein [Phenylobacterium sp. 58.2.17]MCX7587302.1 hypothetical protein [Phenylobacterium sp. 58.2.17]
MKTVFVLPTETGWVVRSDEIENEMAFKAGGRAEVAGRRLAQALAARGEPVEMRIHLKSGELAGRYLCPANDLASSAAVMESDISLGDRPRPA